MKEYTNPFLISGYLSPKYFCDREHETATIIDAIQNDRNLTLFGRRKLGKTALIKQVFHKLQKKQLSIWIDLLPAQNFSDMVNIMANGIYQAFEKNKSFSKKFLDSFRLLRPVISYDDLTGTPQITLDTTNNKQLQKSFEGLINLLKLYDKPIIIALDEFQQILKFPEKDTEAYLRTIIQDLPQLTFIFSGSDQHLLSQMFTQYDKPFYQSSQLLRLDKIDSLKYQKFISKHFTQSGKKIDNESIEYILNWSNGITYQVQYICNRLYSLKTETIDIKTVQNSLNQILSEFDYVFYTYREMLTKMQWRVLRAIASEEIAKNIFSKEFMKKHNFYNASSIKKSVESLIKDQLIYKSNTDGETQYEVQNVFLSKWLARN